MSRSYSELIQLGTFEERFQYLALGGRVAHETFGSERWLNQMFYASPEWKSIRRHVIVRDSGCDLGIDGHDIFSGLLIHHMNPMDVDQVLHRAEEILDPEFLITTKHSTHNAIHYGDVRQAPKLFEERTPNDTIPWR